MVMKFINLLGYAIKQSLKSIHRNKRFSLASLGTIISCLFLLGMFYIILVNVQYMVKNAESMVGISVFFEEGLEQEEIDYIGEFIQSNHDVESVQYISADEAWEKCKIDILDGQEDLIAVFSNDNPLADSASYELYLNDVSKQKEVVGFLERIDGVRKVVSSDVSANMFSGIQSLIAYTSVIIILILLGVSVFLINITVTMGISVRKEEIQIMKLIGASDLFIKAPFLIEGFVIGAVGTTIPLAVLWLNYGRLVDFIGAKYADSALSEMLTFLDSIAVFRFLTPLLFIIGVGIGVVGSYVTTRKQLKA